MIVPLFKHFLAYVAGGIVFALVVLAAKPPFSRFCREKRVPKARLLPILRATSSPLPRQNFARARERSRPLRRLALPQENVRENQCVTRRSYQGQVIMYNITVSKIHPRVSGVFFFLRLKTFCEFYCRKESTRATNKS